MSFILIVRLACILFDQLGNIVSIKNIVLCGHPVLKHQHNQDADGGQHEQLKNGFNKRHGGTDSCKSRYMCEKACSIREKWNASFLVTWQQEWVILTNQRQTLSWGELATESCQHSIKTPSKIICTNQVKTRTCFE